MTKTGPGLLPGSIRKRFMPNIRGETPKPRANSATPDASADIPLASRAKTTPESGGPVRKAGNAQAQGIAPKGATPAAANRAKIASKPKWVSALSSPAPVDEPGEARRARPVGQRPAVGAARGGDRDPLAPTGG